VVCEVQDVFAGEGGITMEKNSEQSTKKNKITVATSKTSPQIKEKLQKISKMLIAKNEVAYRKLANQ
jgi:GTP:adenosylcobinamide-phosphate guanylyltransferase